MTKLSKVNIKFKKLIMKMYWGFPNTLYDEDIVHPVFIMEDIRKILVKHGFLIQEPYIARNKGTKKRYSLGPHAITLINYWKTEKLTKDMKKFTEALLLLTGALVALVILQIYIVLFV